MPPKNPAYTGFGGDGVANIEPYLTRIIDQLSDNEQIWFNEIDKFLLSGIVPKNRPENISEFQYKY